MGLGSLAANERSKTCLELTSLSSRVGLRAANSGAAEALGCKRRPASPDTCAYVYVYMLHIYTHTHVHIEVERDVIAMYKYIYLEAEGVDMAYRAYPAYPSLEAFSCLWLECIPSKWSRSRPKFGKAGFSQGTLSKDRILGEGRGRVVSSFERSRPVTSSKHG